MMPLLMSIMIAKPRNRVAIEIKINEGDSAKIAAINLIGVKPFQ
jgi:outer membrane protein assembly factor BamA